MKLPDRPNPYCGFKDDRERRIALNTRVRWYAVAAVAMAVTAIPSDWMGRFRWLMHLFH